MNGKKTEAMAAEEKEKREERGRGLVVENVVKKNAKEHFTV